MLSDDSTYSIVSQVTDAVTATYTHTLTVTGRLVGEYQCSVSNIRTPSGSSRSLTVSKDLKFNMVYSPCGEGATVSLMYASLPFIIFIICRLKSTVQRLDVNDNCTHT